MDAFHSIWSRPSGKSYYKPEDFDILTTILSALCWKKTNGKIFMVCDQAVADFLRYAKIDFLWDEIFVTLDYIPHSIDAKTYWAAGKLFALSQFSAPIVGIDTDFLVWKKIEFKDKLYVIHREELQKDSYPDYDEFLNFDSSFDFTIPASNTAFFYIGDNDFLKLYTNNAIEFMKKHPTLSFSLPHMLFAEQRLFSMCAKKIGLNITSLSAISDLFSEKNRTFTHLWGYKDILRKNPEVKNSYCKDCIERIISDFPSISSQHLEHLLELL